MVRGSLETRKCKTVQHDTISISSNARAILNANLSGFASAILEDLIHCSLRKKILAEIFKKSNFLKV